MRALFFPLVGGAALASSSLPVVTSSGDASARLHGTKPNIIWLFADDFGWADVGQNNPAVTETPTIDALAKGGIHFTDAHAFPLCTPSRAQLLTGRVGARTGVTTNFVPSSTAGLPRTEHTIAELLKPAGLVLNERGIACCCFNPLFSAATTQRWPVNGI